MDFLPFALLALVILWAANHLHDILSRIEYLLIRISNSIDPPDEI